MEILSTIALVRKTETASKLGSFWNSRRLTYPETSKSNLGDSLFKVAILLLIRGKHMPNI